MNRARSLVLILLLPSGVTSTVARAQPASNSVAAEALFREGRRLLVEKRWAEACGKLEMSQKLEPAVGTLFSLGECREGQARLASAWFAYRAAGSLAAARSDARRALALQRADALEPQLARLVIHLPQQSEPITLRLDGETIPAEASREPLPVDPGPHRIEAQSVQSYMTTIDVSTNGVTLPVDVPSLVPPPLVRVQRVTPWTRDAGYVAVGIGSATVVVGAVLGMQAIIKGRDANHACPSASPCTDQGAVHENDVAKTDADFSTVLLPLGLAVAAAGAYLLVTTHSRFEVITTPSQARLQAEWAW